MNEAMNDDAGGAQHQHTAMAMIIQHTKQWVDSSCSILSVVNGFYPSDSSEPS